jgi:PAS domain S-box-containing protein
MRKRTLQSKQETITIIGTIHAVEEAAMSVEDMQKLISQLKKQKAALEQENEYLKKSQAENNIQLDKVAASQILSLINNTSDFILAVDQRFKILAFNEPMRQMIKLTQGIEIVVGTNLLATIQSDKQMHYSGIYARVLAGERIVEIAHYLMPNGTQSFFEESFNPIRNEFNEIAGFTIISRDITERRRADETIRLRESQIASLINNTADYILYIDSEFTIITVNEPLRRVVKATFGIEVNTGMSVFAIISPDKHAHYRAIYQRVLAGERVTETMVHIVSDNQKRFIEESFNPVWSDNRLVIGFSVFSRNVTERKQREVNLIYRENVLNSIFYESVDALFLTNPVDSMIIQCNKRANELFEMNSEDSLIDKFVLSFHKHPLKAKELKEMDDTLQIIGYWNAEIEYITAQGNVFWGNVTSKRIQISEKNYNLIRVTDIQEKKKAEEKIKWYSARLEGIIESTQDIIFSLDKKLRFTSFNFNCQRIMKQMYGVDIELGMKIIDTLRAFEQDYKNTRKDMIRALQGEQFTVEHTFGSAKIYFETHLNPIRNEEDEVTGVAVFAKDITERKRAEEKLLVSLREKDVLLSEVYHRVKNNLHVVISLLTLQSNRTDDPRVLEALNESKNRIYAMALVHEQLYRSGDMSRINTKEYIISLAQNVREIYLRQTSRVVVKVEAEEHIHFPIDIAIPLGLILNELLTNSFKHAFVPGQDGEIGVKLVDLGQHNYRISVLDNGKGFNLAEITAARPTSLGLRIVEMLVEQMKGKIQFLVAPREEILQKKASQKKHSNEIQINFKYPKS